MLQVDRSYSLQHCVLERAEWLFTGTVSSQRLYSLYRTSHTCPLHGYIISFFQQDSSSLSLSTSLFDTNSLDNTPKPTYKSSQSILYILDNFPALEHSLLVDPVKSTGCARTSPKGSPNVGTRRSMKTSAVRSVMGEPAADSRRKWTLTTRRSVQTVSIWTLPCSRSPPTRTWLRTSPRQPLARSTQARRCGTSGASVGNTAGTSLTTGRTKSVTTQSSSTLRNPRIGLATSVLRHTQALWSGCGSRESWTLMIPGASQ